MANEPRLLGIVRSYDDLILFMRDRAEELGVNRLTLDEIAGLPRGYSAKLLAFPPVKVLGRMSFDLLVQALGFKIQVIEDPNALEQFKKQRDQRKGRGGHTKPLRMKNGKLNFAEIMRGLGRRGGKKRAKILSKKELSASGRRAARSRWRNERKRRQAKTAADRAARKESKALPASQARRILPLQCAGTGAPIGQGAALFPAKLA